MSAASAQIGNPYTLVLIVVRLARGMAVRDRTFVGLINKALALIAQKEGLHGR